MSDYSDRQSIEIFHLLFLDQLGRKVDKRFYALKGGCNLRFFFRSLRYSEDMDFDAAGISVERLKEKVNAILKSEPFTRILHVRSMQIGHINYDEQTQTTQRWKLGLSVSNNALRLPTKIVFSRRGMSDGMKFESVDPVVIAGYRLHPVMINHYSGEATFRQKLGALTDRKEVQARDIFDLDLLLRSGVKVQTLPKKLCGKLSVAKERLLTMEFYVFKSQVVAYLAAEDQELYDADVWDSMRLRVYESIEEIKP